MKKIVLYFNFEDQISEYHLPAMNNRRFQFNLHDMRGEYSGKIDLENWDGKWYIRSNNDIDYTQNNEFFETIPLNADDIICGNIRNSNIYFNIITTEENQEITNFKKYYINEIDEIAIGSESGCTICIYEEYVSRRHALIQARGEGFFLKDISTNGTFLNGKRLLGEMKLECFDEIYIMGIKLVYLKSFIAINSNEKVKTNLSEISLKQLRSESEPDDCNDDSYFSRAPRNMEPLKDETIDIEAPPAKQKDKQQPLLFLLGPSVTMPLPIMLSVIFNMSRTTENTGSLYFGTMISVLASAGIGTMWALMHRSYDQKEGKENEEARVNGYQNYIEKNKKLLEEKHKYNREQLEKQYLSTSKLIHIVKTRKSSLWNRNVNHEDFLTIRLGKGFIPYPGRINIPQERFSLTKDELSQLPFQLYEKYKNMSHCISTISLAENKIIGVIGEHNRVMDVARSIIIQLSALHSYTDVKIAALLGENESNEMMWVRWLPHTFSSDKKVRYIANDLSSYQNVLYELTSELRTRDEDENGSEGAMIPHYVVFCTSADIMEKESIYSYLISNKKYGFTFVLLYENMDSLPNECVRIIQVDSGFEGQYSLNEMRNETNEIRFDYVSVQEAELFAKSISGIYVNEMAGGEIPTSIDFLEMMNIAKLEQWDLLKHYKENRSYEHIRALIGLTYGNKPMYLDIHEKVHGPHGLVAGTTGSGKSETIMTFILSLAMNYHPDEVAFVLIDYKGGGMAAPFIGMPHTAGTITNIDNGAENRGLDENQARRALVSIHSEIQRRQKIFNQYGINHIDTYIRLYRDGQAAEPLPHLIIISDEFAELKKEQPEFIKELVTAARVGRSLGIHLILATQKPAGVVDDEIWSNSRFKICLRVQDKQDSMGMLKRPEAAYITGIGRAFLQIGNDEIFEMFQSGYTGASYEPTDEILLSQHNEASMISLDGAKLVAPVRKQGEKKDKKKDSQLEACIRYIKRVASQNGIQPAHQLWRPPLPAKLYLDDIEKEYKIERKKGICAVIGLIDEPENQTQYPFVLDLLQIANLLMIGSIGMGKTTLLQTLLFSVVCSYSPKQINIYCMDFSSRTFRIFCKLPHFGDVAFIEEEEKVVRMIEHIQSIMKERRAIFDQAEVGSYQEYLHIEQLPLVVLCIDNYMMFREAFEDYEDELLLILREGTKYGVQVFVTITTVNDLPYKMRQNFSMMIPLYLGERTNYTEILGNTPAFTLERKCGRGLIYHGNFCEFQVAIAIKAEIEIERNKKMMKQFEQIAMKYRNDETISSIRTLPKAESYKDLCSHIEKRNYIPLGYNTKNLEYEGINLEDVFCYSFVSSCHQTKNLFEGHLFFYIEKTNQKALFIKKEKAPAEKNVYDISSYEECYQITMILKEEYTKRNQFIKSLKKQNEKNVFDEMGEAFEKIIVYISDLSCFLDTIYQFTEKEKIYPYYEQMFIHGKGMGIHFIAAIDSKRDLYSISGRRSGQLFLDYKTGILCGGSLDNQDLFDFPLTPSEKIKEQSYNVGSYMDHGEFKEVYLPKRTGREEE